MGERGPFSSNVSMEEGHGGAHTAQHGRMAAILMAPEDTQWQQYGAKSRGTGAGQERPAKLESRRTIHLVDF